MSSSTNAVPSLLTLALKKKILQPDIRNIGCGLAMSLLLQVNRGEIVLEDYQKAIFLNKLIEQLPCTEYANIHQLIIRSYEQLPVKMLFVPHDYAILRQRIIGLPLDTTYTKEEVKSIFKYFLSVFPELTEPTSLSLLDFVNHDSYTLVDENPDYNPVTNEINIRLFGVASYPLRNYYDNRDMRQPPMFVLSFETHGYTGARLHHLISQLDLHIFEKQSEVKLVPLGKY